MTLNRQQDRFWKFACSNFPLNIFIHLLQNKNKLHSRQQLKYKKGCSVINIAVNKSFTSKVEVWLWFFFPFSVQKLSEFLSSEEIGEEHDKSSELRSADNHSKYQAVVSKAVSLPVKWLQSFVPRINFSLFHFLLIVSCNCKTSILIS